MLELKKTPRIDDRLMETYKGNFSSCTINSYTVKNKLKNLHDIITEEKGYSYDRVELALLVTRPDLLKMNVIVQITESQSCPVIEVSLIKKEVSTSYSVYLKKNYKVSSYRRKNRYSRI